MQSGHTTNLFIVNMAIGGNFGGQVDDTILPQILLSIILKCINKNQKQMIAL
jgi:hypothetical protein